MLQRNVAAKENSQVAVLCTRAGHYWHCQAKVNSVYTVTRQGEQCHLAADGEPGFWLPAELYDAARTAKYLILYRPPAQGVNRRVKCKCLTCGYLVNTTAKWLKIGPPHCPAHGPMAQVS